MFVVYYEQSEALKRVAVVAAEHILISASMKLSSAAESELATNLHRKNKGVIACDDKEQADYVKTRLVAAGAKDIYILDLHNHFNFF